MAILHDESWIQAEYHDSGPFVAQSHENYCTSLAKRYYEYMSHWRSISEPPGIGAWIEVLCNRNGDIHTITFGPARFKDDDLGWRPAMPLPDTEEG